jgi:hypothetical protein
VGDILSSVLTPPPTEQAISLGSDVLRRSTLRFAAAGVPGLIRHRVRCCTLPRCQPSLLDVRPALHVVEEVDARVACHAQTSAGQPGAGAHRLFDAQRVAAFASARVPDPNCAVGADTGDPCVIRRDGAAPRCAPSSLLMVSSAVPVAVFQVRIVLSNPAEASQVPSAENRQSLTRAVWPARVVPESTAHRRTSRSDPAEASLAASGEKAQPNIWPRSSPSIAIGVPSAGFHRRNVPSSLTDASSAPSGATAHRVTHPV